MCKIRQNHISHRCVQNNLLAAPLLGTSCLQTAPSITHAHTHTHTYIYIYTHIYIYVYIRSLAYTAKFIAGNGDYRIQRQLQSENVSQYAEDSSSARTNAEAWLPRICRNQHGKHILIQTLCYKMRFRDFAVMLSCHHCGCYAEPCGL